ncbi:hypothetical protein V6N11_031749 [Hibiscus sabdariffa]|uniref:Uncharacterized protein n=1 Tax=Hibiscus sabdariffa TaxID=183260 RepID=A0ABR2SZ77_9ROSI
MRPNEQTERSKRRCEFHKDQGFTTLMNLESLDVREEDKSSKLEPIDKIEEVEVYPGGCSKLTMIASGLDKDQKRRLMKLLRNNADVFA